MSTNTETGFKELAVEVFNKCSDGLLVIDNRGEVAMTNPALRLMYGFDFKETVTQQKTMKRLAPDPKERKRIIGLWKHDLAAKNPPARELRMTCADGEQHWYKFHLSHMSNGYHCVKVQDITDGKNTEDALKDSEEMFRNLAEQSPNMIFIFKHFKNRVVYANRHCEVLTGYTRKEIYSPEFSYIRLIAPDFHARMYKAFKRHLTGRETPMREYDLITKNGKRVAIMLTTRLIHFDGDLAILGIMTDVTEMKKVQRDILESSIKLREQKKALQEKNTALKEILALIETEKLQIKRQISINAEKLILPILRKLQAKGHSIDCRYIALLESNIRALVSKFGAELVNGPARFSPKEVELCSMIKSGLSSKDIAELLHISIRTVDTHRNRIRKKLGITSRDINLSTHLQNLT